MNNGTKKKKKNSEGTSCRGDGDGCKSGGGTGQEMRRAAKERVGASVVFVFYLNVCVICRGVRRRPAVFNKVIRTSLLPLNPSARAAIRLAAAAAAAEPGRTSETIKSLRTTRSH